MKWYRMSALVILFGLLPLVNVAHATPDRYKGDTAIYSGTAVKLRPNVLFVVDTSKDMGQAGGVEPYNASVIYPANGYVTNRIYKKINQGNFQDYHPAGVDINSAGYCAAAKTTLNETGFYNKGLDKQTGECSNKSNDFADYYLGNLLNKLNAPVTVTPTWTAGTVYAIGDVVKPTSSSSIATFRCSVAGTSGASEPLWPTTAGSTVVDGTDTLRWEITADLLTVVKAVLKQVSLPLRTDIRMGLMTFGPNNSGGWIKAEVKGLATTDLNGAANHEAFKTAVDGMSFLSTNVSQPVNETLWDAQLYFKGLNHSTAKFASGAARFNAPSPIEYTCQKNYVILLTTGSSTPSSADVSTTIGNWDGIAPGGTIMDAAKLLYETDCLPDNVLNAASEGTQRIQTTVIQLMTSKVDDLETATNGSHGRGEYYQANSTDDLIEALLDTLGNVVREAETAFVAPVVPASPENRTYSGKRIYIGFFKPISGSPWLGNLKKFAINNQNQIVSTDGETLATNNNGTFNAGATSFWSPNGDAGNVLIGGIGGVLKNRVDARKIYTYTGASKILTDTANAFDTTNTAIPLSAGSLGVTVEDRDKLIKFVRGIDGYNDNGDGDTLKRDWLLGDILHSKPLVVPFKKYTFSTANEINPDLNKTYIFQGTNDGMLHAFRDHDGSEAWAFIPPDLLPRLKHLRDASHSYYVDTTPSTYLHDANGDGNIVKADGDRAILIFGLRRGGGTNVLSSAGSHGAFYALDVSDPEAPEFLWQIDSETAGFEELAQSWSQPKLARFKIGSEKKVAMIIGAGYDNAEDLRYGSTQTYPADTSVTYATDDFTTGKSSGTSTSPQYPRGRGIYVVELATMTGSPLAPVIATTPTKIWSYTYGASTTTSATGKTSPEMTFSIPADVFSLDRNYDGYTDRLYVGDVGGNMWRFNVGDTDPNNWTGKKIFSSNPGSDSTNGRKIFYKPDVTFLDSQNSMIYFGTGDREHPQNYLNPGIDGAVIDRIYAFRDKDTTSTVLTEANMVDVTANILQQDTLDSAVIEAERARLLDPDKYGWYIRLNAAGHAGEKVLAPSSVFNQVAFCTTYQPHTFAELDLITNPCQPGNLGTSRLYAVNYLTGEAVYNFNTGAGTDVFGENQDSSTNTNAQAKDKDGNAFILRRSDREMKLGGGIPSGMVFIIGANGKVTVLTSADASFPSMTLDGSGVIFPVYWLQR